MSDKYPGIVKKVLCILCNQNLSISTTKHDCFYRQKEKDINVNVYKPKSHK